MSYPNQYEMKKNRLIVLKKSKGKCVICEKRAQVVHHDDFSLDNHSVDNLMPLCHKCHKIVHCNEVGYSTSKYKRIYGLTQTQLSERLDVSKGKIYELHILGELKQVIEKRREMEKFLCEKNSK